MLTKVYLMAEHRLPPTKCLSITTGMRGRKQSPHRFKLQKVEKRRSRVSAKLDSVFESSQNKYYF